MFDGPQSPHGKKPPLRHRRMVRYLIPSQTEMPKILTGKRSLVIFDVAGTLRSMGRLDYRLELATLAKLLTAPSKETKFMMLFPSQTKAEAGPQEALARTGWSLCPVELSHAEISAGESAVTSPDNFILAVAGFQLASYQPEAVVFATPEAATVLAFTDAMEACGHEGPLVTLSMVGSSTHRLAPDRCPRIAGRISIGLDCLSPMSEGALPIIEVMPREQLPGH